MSLLSLLLVPGIALLLDAAAALELAATAGAREADEGRGAVEDAFEGGRGML